MEGLLDVPEVADLLGVKTSWVYTKVANGQIPHVKVGRYVRFAAKDVLEWVKAETRAARAARPQ